MSAVAAEIVPTRISTLDGASAPSTPLLDVPSLQDFEKSSWDSSIFHSHISAAINKEAGAVQAFAEYATTEIQAGNLANLLKTITSTYEGNEDTQMLARDTVMKTYLSVIDANGMGVSTYDAVTSPPSPLYAPQSRLGISTENIIDPQY
jgi:hypothetical protein